MTSYDNNDDQCDLLNTNCNNEMLLDVDMDSNYAFKN